MPMREVLTPSQRIPFEEIPADLSERDLARYYTLTATDLARIKDRRRPANRLGYVVQLAWLRYPGFPWTPNRVTPPAVLSFLAAQINELPSVLEDYAGRDPTRREHLTDILQVYGYQPFRVDHYRDLATWIMPLALSTDQSVTLMEALVEEVRTRRIVRPALYKLERLVWEARRRAQHRISDTLAGDLTDAHRQQLDALLAAPPEWHRTRLAWLRDAPGAAKPAAFLKVIERLQYLRDLNLDATKRQQIHANRFRKLAREGETYSPQALMRFADPRRYATLVAFALDSQARLTDAALEMHDQIIGQLFTQGQRTHLHRFRERGKEINRTVRIYVRLGRHLIQAREQGRDAYEALEELMSWDEFVSSVDDADEQARPEDFDYLDLLDPYYPQLRKYVPKLLETFTFQAAPPSQSVVDALTLVRDLGRKKVPDGAPLAFVKSRWEEHVVTDDGIKRHYYEMCALAELRNGLRSGDIWVEGSNQYQQFDRYLLCQEEWNRLCTTEQVSLGVPAQWPTYLNERREQLHQRFVEVGAMLEAGTLPGVKTKTTNKKGAKKQKLSITSLDADIPEGVDELTQLIYGRVRRVRITQLLEEIDALTHFTRHFTHLYSGDSPASKIVLFTALLAEATNLGLAKMADATPGVTYRQLTWLADWYMRDECYSRALAEVINYHHRLAFSSLWGDGTSSSSDGQRFPVGGRRSLAGRLNAKYGSEPGILIVTHISDQYSPFHTKAITGNAKEAPYLVDGLLYHETTLPLKTHAADTGEYTDQIFGICTLLGFRFTPRLRDMGDRRLYPFEKAGTYPIWESMIGGTINVKQIEAHWDDLRRLATSLKLGTVTASSMLKKLAAYPRQNGLAWALREVGRIEKSLYMLDWFQIEELRRQVLISLNKGEGRNALSRAVLFYRRGTVQERDHREQQERAQGLNLIVAAIILWNTLEIDRAVNDLRAEGHQIPDERLQHVSPMDWEHICLTGEYLWEALRAATKKSRKKPQIGDDEA